jgi:hypothetical protein
MRICDGLKRRMFGRAHGWWVQNAYVWGVHMDARMVWAGMCMLGMRLCDLGNARVWDACMSWSGMEMFGMRTCNGLGYAMCNGSECAFVMGWHALEMALPSSLLVWIHV